MFNTKNKNTFYHINMNISAVKHGGGSIVLLCYIASSGTGARVKTEIDL